MCIYIFIPLVRNHQNKYSKTKSKLQVSIWADIRAFSIDYWWYSIEDASMSAQIYYSDYVNPMPSGLFWCSERRGDAYTISVTCSNHLKLGPYNYYAINYLMQLIT